MRIDDSPLEKGGELLVGFYENSPGLKDHFKWNVDDYFAFVHQTIQKAIQELLSAPKES